MTLPPASVSPRLDERRGLALTRFPRAAYGLRMRWSTVLLMLVAGLAQPVLAGQRSAACLLACGPAIARCVTAVRTFGLDERECRRTLVRRCKRAGASACAPSGELPAEHPLAGAWLLTLRTCSMDCSGDGPPTIDCERPGEVRAPSIVRFQYDDPARMAGDLDLIDTANGGWWGGGSAPWFGQLEGDRISFSIPVGPHPYLTGTIEGDRIDVRFGVAISADPCDSPPSVGEMRRISCAAGGPSFPPSAP